MGTVVHVAVDGAYAGHLVVADQIKDSAAPALKALKEAGVRQTVMLTGDDPAVAQSVGQQLGLDQVHAGLLPGDKVDWVERLLKEKRPGEQLVFVGDGINDAPCCPGRTSAWPWAPWALTRPSRRRTWS